MLVLSNATINIPTNKNFEQIIVVLKVFHQAKSGLGFEEIGIDFEQVLGLAN